MKTRLIFIMLIPFLITNCASIVSGTNQSITVETRYNGSLVANANCEINNNKGKWWVKTPGSVTVHRSYGPLHIKCTKAKINPGMAVVHSSTKAMAFGNILFGGIIGAGVDMKTGAAYNYPNMITLVLGNVDQVIGKPPAQPDEPADGEYDEVSD